jgi:hypothetical protein
MTSPLPLPGWTDSSPSERDSAPLLFEVHPVKERPFRLLRRLVQPTVDRAVSDYYFDVYRRERLYRQEFFFNAFKALRFNGIAGD